MRYPSAAMIKQSLKRNKRFKKGRKLQDKPREGTKTREVYDMFMEKRGLPVYVAFSSAGRKNHTSSNPHYNQRNWPVYDYTIVTNLNTFYGLDIRRLRNGEWVLAGEYCENGTYVDYIAEHIKDN